MSFVERLGRSGPAKIQRQFHTAKLFRQPLPEIFKPADDCVRLFDKAQCRIGRNAHKVDVSGKCGAYLAGSIETDRLVMGYAVAELPYLSQFAINVTLHHPVCLVREYAQQCFLPHTVVATCKKVCPKAERERSHHLVIGINAFTRKVLIGFLYRFLVISQQTTGSTYLCSVRPCCPCRKANFRVSAFIEDLTFCLSSHKSNAFISHSQCFTDILPIPFFLFPVLSKNVQAERNNKSCLHEFANR